MGMQIFCRLLSPGLENEGKYWHRYKRRKLVLDLPVQQFRSEIWPGRGLSWADAVEISNFLNSGLFRPGVHKLTIESLLLEVYEA
jgi:hypothetical protein